MQTQDQLDDAFGSYKKDLQALGKALDSAVVETLQTPPATAQKKSPVPTSGG